MHEIELKFQVPAARRAAVDAAVAGRTGLPRTRLQAAYVDTAERALATAGLALRMRREGRQWVQTLKGAAADGMTRLEHNVPRGAGAAVPAIDLALHAGTPVGETLAALLAGRSPDALAVLFRTDIMRRARALRTPHGRVELAFDAGSIRAVAGQVGVCELEIELLAGSPMAVLDTARRWLPRFGLWLDTRSKAERGDLLARGETMAASRQATLVRLMSEQGAAPAWLAVLSSCADQILVNASQISSGEHAPEHVHQLRVGLRRLRSALRLFDGMGAEASLGKVAATLFRRLGGARDAVVIEGEFAAELIAAMRLAGVAGEAPVAAPPGVDVSPTEMLRETGSQRLMLDLLAAMHTPRAAIDTAVDLAAPETAPVLRDALARRLNRWHRQLVADLARFADLDDASRHQLRKRAKRLRYAAEFCGSLFERRALRRYLKVLRALQERLGAISDVVMAMQAFARTRDSDPRAMFALGWLAARRERLIADAAPELKAFGKVERFWKVMR
jgi:inorganic triphosphatase YgiF